jgi:DNA-binding response OmpR family regulator
LKNSTAMRLPDDILLVEDEPAIVDFMRRVLLRAGYSVRVATTGRQALAALAERTPALLILDLILPDLHGFAVLDHIHQHRLAVPIIIITANPQTLAALYTPGIHRYLVKPFRVDELLRAVRSYGMSLRAEG